jgi:IPT/TIG domain
MPARLLLALLLVLFYFCSPLTLAGQVGNFCPSGTCDITNPVYVNVYWETSTQAFDKDEIAAGQGDMLSGRIDALTRALTHSNYFLGLAGYSVTSATFLRGVAAGSCAPLPFTIQPPNNYLNQEMKTLTSCVLGANPDINPSTTILNVFYPPQVVPTSATADYCTKYSGDHDQFWTPVGITRIPTHPTCNPNITALFTTLTHEMVEAATDPVPASPTGWKTFGGGSCDEIGDVCACPGGIVAPTPRFLYASLSEYWVDGTKACFSPALLSVPPGATPAIVVSSVSGGGQSTLFTLAGTSIAGSAVGAPWDLVGGKTLYLQASIAHPGQAPWSAGNIEGTPPDQVGFGFITWTDNGATIAIKVSGFDGNYGSTINQSVAVIAPGDVVTFTYSDPQTGLSTTATGTAPFPATITAALDETRPKHPTVQEFETFSGEVADTLGRGMQGASVTCTNCLDSPTVLTVNSGAFILPLIQPGPIAKQQQVILGTPGANQSEVTLALQIPVFPVVTSIQPAIGTVAGGTAVTLTGAGFDPNTAVDLVNFDSPFPVFHGGHAQATPQSVAPNSSTAQLQTPKSPLGGDGSGYANVSATVNQLQSGSLEFLYVVPGKPVLVINPFLCGGGQIAANVYAADGTPVSVGVTLSASYPAFQQSGGGLTQSIVVTSGQSVNFIGAGTFTATNNQTSQSVTQILTVPSISPCTVGTILLPKIPGTVFWNPGPFINHGGPNCIVCGPGSTNTVIWTQGINPTTAAGSVTIAGSSQQQIRSTYQVRAVGGEEFQNYVVAGTLAAVRNAGVTVEARATTSSLGTINFVGPAMAVERRHHRDDDDDKDDKSKRKKELFKITFQIPKDGTSGQDFHVLHLVQINGTPCWTEAQATSVSGHGASVTVTTEETGVYALAQMPGSNGPAQGTTQKKSMP